MSTNPQWKSFQPPDTMNQDSAIIDFKPMTSNGKASQAFNYSNNRSTSTSRFGQEFPMLQQQDKSSSSSNHHSQQQQQQHHHHHHHHHHSHSSSSVGNFGTGASNPSSSATTNGLYGSSSTTHASSRFPPIGTFMLDTNNMYNSSGDGSGVVSSSNSVSNNSMSTNNMVSGVFSTSAMNGNSGSNGGNGAGNPVTSSSTNSYNNSSSSNSGGGNNDSNSSNLGTRETGIIEKLLHSYGFIQCCERQARLFFHFSQFSGNIEHLKIGDPVEFEMTYDRRTGKPIASSVTKIAPEVVMSEERVTGTVTTEVRGEGSGGDATGRISYENRGECFFLPYTKDDVEGNVTLRSGDKVSFQIATNNRGNLGACHVRLENPAHPVKYQGVVCSMKESFGFIERADVVKEIFFHFSEAKTKEELRLGDDVEFTIQTRNGKEVACNITRLPTGTVIFEDLKPEIMKGQVLKPLDRGLNARQQLQQSQQQQILLQQQQQQQQQQQADALPGRIRYRAPDHSEVEISFGDKDQKGDFTLRHGDWVQFKIATDRRDGLNRATNISLLDESFLVSGERREQGVVASVKDGFGFLKCVDREARLFFHFNEILDVEREVQPGDEFEFTVVQDQCNTGGTFSSANNRQSAIRMKWSPHGTVQFETRLENQVSGTVTKEIAPSSSGGWPNNRSPTKNNGLLLMMNQNGEGVPEAAGCITYQAFGGVKKQVAFYSKDCDLKQFPRLGDKVEFNINQVKRNKELIAVDIQVVQPANTTPTAITIQQTANGIKHRNSTNTNNGQIYQGFIAALKEGFGFIETIQHDKEVFFHFSNFEGDPNTLELGQEVEYNLATTRNNNSNNNNNGMCSSAENVKVIPKGTITLPAVTNPDLVLDGRVVRPLRSANPEQKEYSGLIRIVKGGGEGEKQRGEDSIVVESENEMPFDENPEEGEDGKQQPQTPPVEYEFGIMGLVNKRELLQVDDHVQLQVDSTGRAANIVAVRKKLRATVDSIKGNFGFLAYEVEEGKKLFFHMTEVKDNVSLQVGDTVEFVLVNNHRSGKSSACSVVKVSDVQARPERLISRLRTVSLDEAGPKLTVVRQPKGPDGTKGFNNVAGVRSPRQPGVIPLTSLNNSVTSSSATPPVVVE